MRWPATALIVATLATALAAEPALFRSNARHDGSSSPAAAAGRVYVGSFDGTFYALDAAHGTLAWKFATEGERRFSARHLHGAEPAAEVMPDPFDVFLSSPALAGGVVYFGSGDGNVYALEAASGELRWSFSNKGSWVISSPAVRDGRVYFATSDSGLLHVLDAKTGAAVFSLDFNHWPFFSSPTLAGHYLYIGSHQGRLLAIDLETRQLAWTSQTDGARKNGPTYTKADGTPNYGAVVSDSFYDQMVIGVDRMMSVGAVLSTPVIDADTVFFGSWDGQLYALS